MFGVPSLGSGAEHRQGEGSEPQGSHAKEVPVSMGLGEVGGVSAHRGEHPALLLLEGAIGEEEVRMERGI